MTQEKTNKFFIIAVAFILSIAIFLGSCENDLSLSQDSSDQSHNETESLVSETFQNSINQTNI
jgi:PBP1b-binding outer membrane lipoprotein LpoB